MTEPKVTLAALFPGMTRRPWKVMSGSLDIWDADETRRVSANPWPSMDNECRANARAIVHAVSTWDQVVGALEAVEWLGPSVLHIGVGHKKTCTLCCVQQPNHADDCKLSAALTAARGDHPRKD